MTILHPVPYEKIVNQSFADELRIVIRSDEYSHVTKKEGQPEICFEGCNFRKVTVVGDKVELFKEILILFLECHIEELIVENIKTQKLSFAFLSCILSTVLRGPNILSVIANNCILTGSFFCIGAESVRIYFTQENIFAGRWRKMLKRCGKDYKKLLENDQRYYLIDVGNSALQNNISITENSGKLTPSNNFGVAERSIYNLSETEINSICLSLNVDGNESTGTSTKIDNLPLRMLSLSNLSNSKIQLENVMVEEIYCHDIASSTELQLYHVRPRTENGIFSIHQCNLEKSWFDNVEFDAYARISLYRSKLSKTVFTSCTFPDSYQRFQRFMPIANVHYPEQKPSNYAKDQYEILLQLRMALDATGNFYEAQKMQALSFEALDRLEVSSGDRVMLALNRTSNYHGLSIERPVLWFIGMTVFCYVLYLLSLGKIFDCSKEVDWNLAGYYFAFIDVTHRSDFLVDKEHINGGALAIDYISKIVSGYLIFQFIAAFRKYGKKGS